MTKSKTILCTLLLLLTVCLNLSAKLVFNRYGMILVKNDSSNYVLRDIKLFQTKLPEVLKAPGLLTPYTYVPEKIKPIDNKLFEIETVVYKKYDTYHLDIRIYKPLKFKNVPVLFYIHGGGYTHGNNKSFDKYSKYIASQGVAVVSINYSLDNDKQKADFDKTIADLKDAVEFTRVHAEDYGFDMKRFGFAGHSAGGHLSAYMAMITPGTTLAITMSGLHDMNLASTQYAKRKYFSKYASDNISQISTTDIIPQNAPVFMIIHGTGDYVVSVEHSKLLAAALSKKDIPNELLIYPYLIHNFIAADNMYYEDYLLKMITFLKKNFKL